MKRLDNPSSNVFYDELTSLLCKRELMKRIRNSTNTVVMAFLVGHKLQWNIKRTVGRYLLFFFSNTNVTVCLLHEL